MPRSRSALTIALFAILVLILGLWAWEGGNEQAPGTGIPLAPEPDTPGQAEGDGKGRGPSSADPAPATRVPSRAPVAGGEPLDAEPETPWWQTEAGLRAWRERYATEIQGRSQYDYAKMSSFPPELIEFFYDRLWMSLAGQTPELAGPVNAALRPEEFNDLLPGQALTLSNILVEQHRSWQEWEGVPTSARRFPLWRLESRPFEYPAEFHLDALGAPPDALADESFLAAVQAFQRRMLRERALLSTSRRMFVGVAGKALLQAAPGDGEPPSREWPELLGDREYIAVQEALLRQEEEYREGLRRLLEEFGHLAREPGSPAPGTQAGPGG